MTGFVRFPRTPHLAWLGPGRPRQDKLLTAAEVQALLSAEVVVEEKVDGANLGFSTDEHGTVRAQHRGAYLAPGEARGEFKSLASWLQPRLPALAAALFPDLILFGEWCYAVHSVRYTRLPDWFLAFDVYDRRQRVFWSVPRRDALARELGLAVVPWIARGRFDLPGLMELLGDTQLGDGPAEGIYVRREDRDHLVARAKLVRPEFAEQITEHWSRRPLQRNRLASERNR